MARGSAFAEKKMEGCEAPVTLQWRLVGETIHSAATGWQAVLFKVKGVSQHCASLCTVSSIVVGILA